MLESLTWDPAHKEERKKAFQEFSTKCRPLAEKQKNEAGHLRRLEEEDLLLVKRATSSSTPATKSSRRS